MEKQRSCPICYENYDNVEAGVSCVQVNGCGHDFCRGCLQHHCLLTIQEHEKLPITCPSSSCSMSLPKEQLHNILCSESHELESCTCKPWIKYQQRAQMQRDPSLVPCTKCEALLSSSSSSSTNTLHCSCGHVFCSIHGDAHVNMTCEEYQNCALSTDQMLSETAVRDTTKPCPHCDARIELYGGCEHVVCSTCHNDFCYKCGRYEYLVGNTIRTCTLCNQSYMDHRKLEKQRVKACLMLPLTLTMAILYMVIAAASAMASGCCCMCFGCGVFVGNDDELQPPDPKKGMRMTLIYIIWPLLDILTNFGIPAYNGWIVEGIERELGIVPAPAFNTLDELSTVASESEVDDFHV